MGFLDSLKTWFRSESADAKDLLGDTRSRLDSDLDRREAELNASPAQRMEQLQEQIAGDDSLDSLRDKVEGRGAKADAVEELMVEGGAEPDDIVDAELVDEADTTTTSQASTETAADPEEPTEGS